MARPAAAEVAGTVLRAVEATVGVAGTDSGPLGTRVTYGAGGRVPGVTVRDGDGTRTATVHLVLEWGPDLRAVADAARRGALTALKETWPDEGPFAVDAEVTDVVVAQAAGRSTGGLGSAGETPWPALEAGPQPAALEAHRPEAVPVDLGGAGSITASYDAASER